MRKTTRGQLERAARVYRTNRQASEALGIATRTFTRQCEKLGIAMPSGRKGGRRVRRYSGG